MGTLTSKAIKMQSKTDWFNSLTDDKRDELLKKYNIERSIEKGSLLNEDVFFIYDKEILGVRYILFDASKVDLNNVIESYTFNDWFEDFEKLADSKNLIITEQIDVIMSKWYDVENFTIEQGIEKYTR